MVVGSIQMDVIKNDKASNLNNIQKLLNKPADLIVLPELFSTGYYYDSVDQLMGIAEEIPEGYTTKRLCEIARESNCYLTGAIVEKEKGQLYITAIVTGPSGYIGKQRKRHLTDHEAQFFTYGNSSEIFDINGCRVGVLICFEGWFPESARELMLKGAQIICHSLLTCQERTLDIMRIRAIENKVYLVIANSVSTEILYDKKITFRGDSRIIDYNGNILINAEQGEKLITTAIDEKYTVHKDLEDCRDLISEVKRYRYL